jgi:hypothetical protein|tara:strand:+ start:333 stop:806 length:474 start_codon:yes stop_codon:yes gene_type:complete
MAVLSGKAHWASISSPNSTFEPVWQVDLAVEGVELEKAKEMGLTIMNKDDDRGEFVRIKRKVYRKDGSKNKSPILKDSKNHVLSEVNVGNGSDVRVLFKSFDWEYAGKKGIGADLQAMQVINLIEYEAGEDFDVIDDGYIASNAFDDDDIPLVSASN